MPGSGEITIAPVSVCHHVSTTGHRFPPMCSRYHIHASGLIGSPTEPSRGRRERSCFAGQWSPHFMNARIAVGAVYRIVTPSRSQRSQKRSFSGQSGAPSYITQVAPLASGPYTRYEWPVTQPTSAVHQKTSSSLRSNTIFLVGATPVRYPPVV